MVVGYIQVRWVHLSAPWGLSSSSVLVSFGRAFEVREFIRARQGGRRVHYVSLSSFGGRSGLMRACPGGRWVHSGSHLGSLGSLVRALGVFGFIKFRLVYSGAHWGSLGSFRRALGVDGFI